MVDALDNEDLSPLAEDQRRQRARNPVAIQANCTCSALTLAQCREEIAAAKRLPPAGGWRRPG
jgi:hypothetical protein